MDDSTSDLIGLPPNPIHITPFLHTHFFSHIHQPDLSLLFPHISFYQLPHHPPTALSTIALASSNPRLNSPLFCASLTSKCNLSRSFARFRSGSDSSCCIMEAVFGSAAAVAPWAVVEGEESGRAETRARAAAGSWGAWLVDEEDEVGRGWMGYIHRRVERRGRRGFLLVAWCFLWVGAGLLPLCFLSPDMSRL